ncbi:MAG: PAS domain S-box protein [Actinobacteria bacterium]|nr:PAS domain S-box protein [Actinomycetota bacterium]
MSEKIDSKGTGEEELVYGREDTRSIRVLSLLIAAGTELITLVIFAVLLATKTLSLMGFILGLALVSAAITTSVSIYYYVLTKTPAAAPAGGESMFNLNIYDSSLDGIVIFDLGGDITDCNQAFADLLDYGCDELRGLNNSGITPGEWLPVDEDINENQVKRSGFSDEYAKEYVRRDGTVFPVSLRVWRLDDREGAQVGTWAIVKDISDRKRYESFIYDTILRLEKANERLEEVDTLKMGFVSIVSHELRSPLTTVQTGLTALEEMPPDAPPEVREQLLGALDRGVRRLSRLIDDTLDLTRIESGQLKLKLEPVGSVELPKKLAAAFEARFAAKGIALNVEVPDDPCVSMQDPDRIEQVLTNLLENALKFTDKGTVTVMVECNPNRVIYSVSDSGPGIPPELHQKIFEQFFSTEEPHESEKGGIGLGLAICKGIVEAHGGGIWVESRKGEGSTFIFDIPREAGNP